jgi:HK97 family phage portal protein
MLDWFRNLFERKGGDLGNPPQALLDALGVWPSSASVSLEVALRVPAVSAAVRAISEAVACLPVSVCRVLPDGAREEVREHPVNALLQGEWNEWCGTYDGLLAGTTDALCNDNGALVWVNRIDGVPRELIRYRPGSFTVDYDLATGEPMFRLATANGGNRPLPISDVIHVRAFGGSARCPLTLAREAIGVALAIEQHVSRLFTRGARPSGVLKFKRKLDDAAFERLKKSWGTAYSGENSGRTAILEDDADFQALTFSSTDAQLLELRQFQIIEIARAFRVPPHMLFDLGRATWSNVESLGREFLVFCLQPMLRAWESALRRALLTPEERAAGFTIEFEEDDLTQASIADRAVAYSSLISARVINPNTARKWERLPPYPDGETYLNPNVQSGSPAAPAKLRAAS